MKFIADLQIHSKYSRATSPAMVVENLSRWAKLKGIRVLGTGDFTHPLWLQELKEKLVPKEEGLFMWKDDPDQGSSGATRFMLTAETSHIYSKKGRVRRVHLLIFAPSFAVVEKINTKLSWAANLASDGRPIIGMDSKELVKIVMDADPNCMIVPAHSWTPWYSVFGSMSGFDSLEECFEETLPSIWAIETGLSSDPAMNWRLTSLDGVAIISNSDAHSLQKIGREGNAFDTELSYQGIVDAIKARDPSRFLFTIEFFPEEGKYHYDGHRLCGVRLSPEERRELGGRCPRCRRPVTVGVLSRVEELADRPPGYTPERAIPYRNLVPLGEIIAEALAVEPKAKRVEEEYIRLSQKFGGELPLLLEGDLSLVDDARLREGIQRVREGRLEIQPGYDGEYGKIKIFGEDEAPTIGKPQMSLFTK